MPLVDGHPRGELTQGDILRAPRLYRSSADGQAQLLSCPFGLVLSRNCRAVRDASIVIVAIQAYSIYEKLKTKREDPDELRRIFDSVRDGIGAPDVFYLGTLPGGKAQERFAARLDSVFTVSLPDDATRQTRIDSNRVARLTQEHLRQLHIRLMNAFATEGYNDLEWWPREDLDFFIEAVKENISRKDVEITEAEQKLALHDMKTAEAKQHREREKLQEARRGLEKALEKLQSERQTIADTYNPHFAQQRRLRGDAG